MARSKRTEVMAGEPPVSVTYFYIRPGHFLSGLPARDMTEAEWNEQDAALRDLALALDLYQRVEEPVSASPVDDAPLEPVVSDEQPGPGE